MSKTTPQSKNQVNSDVLRYYMTCVSNIQKISGKMWFCIGAKEINDSQFQLVYTDGNWLNPYKILDFKPSTTCAGAGAGAACFQDLQLQEMAGGAPTFLGKLLLFFKNSNRVTPVLPGLGFNFSETAHELTSVQEIPTDLIPFPPEIMMNIFGMLGTLDDNQTARLVNTEFRDLVNETSTARDATTQLDATQIQMRMRLQLYYYILMLSFHERVRLSESQSSVMFVTCSALDVEGKELFRITTQKLSPLDDITQYTTTVTFNGGLSTSFIKLFDISPSNHSVENIHKFVQDQCAPDWTTLMNIGKFYNKLKVEQLVNAGEVSDVSDFKAIIMTKINLFRDHFRDAFSQTNDTIETHKRKQELTGMYSYIESTWDFIELLIKDRPDFELDHSHCQRFFEIYLVEQIVVDVRKYMFDALYLTHQNIESDKVRLNSSTIIINNICAKLETIQQKVVIPFNQDNFDSNIETMLQVINCISEISRYKSIVYSTQQKVDTDTADFNLKLQTQFMQQMLLRLVGLYINYNKLTTDATNVRTIARSVSNHVDTLYDDRTRNISPHTQDTMPLRCQLMLGATLESSDLVIAGINFTLYPSQLLLISTQNNYSNLAKICLYGRPKMNLNEGTYTVEGLHFRQVENIVSNLHRVDNSSPSGYVCNSDDKYQEIYRLYVAGFMTAIVDKNKHYLFKQFKVPEDMASSFGDCLKMLKLSDAKQKQVDAIKASIFEFNTTYDPMRNIQIVLSYREDNTFFSHIYSGIDLYYKPLLALLELLALRTQTIESYTEFYINNGLHGYFDEARKAKISPEYYKLTNSSTIHTNLTLYIREHQMLVRSKIYETIEHMKPTFQNKELWVEAAYTHLQKYQKNEDLTTLALVNAETKSTHDMLEYIQGVISMVKSQTFDIDALEENVTLAVYERLINGGGDIIKSIISKHKEYNVYIQKWKEMFVSLRVAELELLAAKGLPADSRGGGISPRRWLRITDFTHRRKMRMRKPVYKIGSRYMVRYSGKYISLSKYTRKWVQKTRDQVRFRLVRYVV